MVADPSIDYDTLEPASMLAYVRSLIPDMELLPDPHAPQAEPSYLFDDATLVRYIAFARGKNPKRAAADACHAVAGSEMLILKSITTEDLVTKGDALGKVWEEKAARLRKEADEDDDSDGAGDNSDFLSVPFIRRPLPYDASRHFGRGRW